MTNSLMRTFRLWSAQAAMPSQNRQTTSRCLCDQFAAYRRLNMLKNSFKASGYQVRDSDIRAEHETMNTGFVVTYLGKFVAAYEIVQVGE